MRIFVLEDDFSQQTRIETTIEKLLKEHHITPSSFEVFGKPDQLLAEVHEKGAHQLFFLDIEIRNEEMKGLEVARKIRDRDPYALIVFVTTHSEFMPLSFRYQVSALDYIDKALSAEEFESRIETALLYANSQIVRVWRKIAFTLNQNLLNSSILLKRFTISKRLLEPIVLFSIPRRTGWNLQRV